ncbi:hypothetical protein [Microbispora rosea]|uniref:hypothetical protein n=1 Tax=Microbispora rosea TaxID=58117 RepID=UPI003D8E4900
MGPGLERVRPKSAGRTAVAAGLPSTPLLPFIVLFSAGRATSLTLAEKVAGQGAVMINNSSASRRDPDVPLMVCEVNPHALAHRSSVSPPEEPKRLIGGDTGRRRWDSKGCASSLSSSDVQDQRCAHLGTPAQQDSAQRRRTPLNTVGGASGKSKPAGENPVTGPVRFPSPAPYGSRVPNDPQIQVLILAGPDQGSLPEKIAG